jgi:Helix-turn-helix domain
MSTNPRNVIDLRSYPLLVLRFEIQEASDILRMSRAQVYNRIAQGAIKAQKDGARTYITLKELERYVASCEDRNSAELVPR